MGTAVLVVCAFGVGAVPATAPTTTPASQPTAIRASQDGPGNSATDVALSTLEALERAAIAKNIFMPARPENPATVEAEAAPVPPTNEELVLTGTMSQGPDFLALLEDKADRRSLFVGVGDMVGPWRVARIDIDQVILKKDDGTEQVVALGGRLPATLPPPPGADSAGTSALPTGASLDSIEERLRRRREQELKGR